MYAVPECLGDVEALKRVVLFSHFLSSLDLLLSRLRSLLLQLSRVPVLLSSSRNAASTLTLLSILHTKENEENDENRLMSIFYESCNNLMR